MVVKSIQGAIFTVPNDEKRLKRGWFFDSKVTGSVT